MEAAGCAQLTACCPTMLADERLCAVQLAARVDAGSPMNDPARHPESAYLPVEQQLARLEALSGAVPLCLPANRDLYRQAMPASTRMCLVSNSEPSWQHKCACVPRERCIREAMQLLHQHGAPALYHWLPHL